MNFYPIDSRAGQPDLVGPNLESLRREAASLREILLLSAERLADIEANLAAIASGDRPAE